MHKPPESSCSKATNVSDTIIAIKANDDYVLKKIYTENYHKVEYLVLKNNGTKEQAKDLYQDSFIAFWKNINNGKFKPNNRSSINGYLYTVAKYKWINHLRSNKRRKVILANDDSQIETTAIYEESIDDIIEKERLLDKAMVAFKKLGQPCKLLLTRFYFEKKSMKEIAEELQLDPASARNKKYRCMQKLREIALKL